MAESDVAFIIEFKFECLQPTGLGSRPLDRFVTWYMCQIIECTIEAIPSSNSALWPSNWKKLSGTSFFYSRLKSCQILTTARIDCGNPFLQLQTALIIYLPLGTGQPWYLHRRAVRMYFSKPKVHSGGHEGISKLPSENFSTRIEPSADLDVLLLRSGEGFPKSHLSKKQAGMLLNCRETNWN